MEELEVIHQNERLAEWKTKCEPLHKWLTGKAIEAKSLKAVGSDLLTVQKQHGETKVNDMRIILLKIILKLCSVCLVKL